MASFNSVRSAAYDSVNRQQSHRDMLGLNPYERHKRVMADYVQVCRSVVWDPSMLTMALLRKLWSCCTSPLQRVNTAVLERDGEH